MILIGDVHGNIKTLRALLAKVPGEKICLVGDLIDRGPRSADVVSYVIDQGFDCVMGNHERMMIDWHEDSYMTDYWLDPRNGGQDTRDNYKGKSELWIEHIEWMRELPHVLIYDDVKDSQGRGLLITHAHPFTESITYLQNSQDTLWSRGWPVEIPGYFNVHGHTPVKEPVRYGYENKQKVVQPADNSLAYSVDIDTGAFFGTGRWKEFAAQYDVEPRLTALRWPEMEFIFQPTID